MPDKPTESFDLTIDGRKYEIDLSDFTVRDVRDFRKELGVPLASAFAGGLDPLEVAAGIKWIIERRDKPGLTFDEVADSMTYASLTEPEGEPEASDPS